jgi:hypothetical protein
MVYENLHEIHSVSNHDLGLSVDGKLHGKLHYIIETRRASNAILRTCRGIRDEAKEIVQKNVKATGLTRLIVETPSQEEANTFDGLCTLINSTSNISPDSCSITSNRSLTWDEPTVYVPLPFSAHVLEFKRKWWC